MAGIVSYGAYIPLFRLSRETISRAWSRGAARGERSVANHDEDSVTMAVEAASDCIKGVAREQIDGLFFASTTSPYREKQNAALIAAVVDLRRQIITADFANSLRAGTAALRAALDAVNSGSARSILVTIADCRLAAPQSEFEQSFGDGAAAFLIGRSDVVAEVEDFYSHADEITDVWRTDQDTFVQVWEDRWVLEHGYTRNVREAVSAIMKKNGCSAKDFTKAVFYGPDARSHSALAAGLGFKDTQIQNPLLNEVGNTGAAHAPMVLTAALQEAKPGDRIIAASYGDGSDAFILKVTEAIDKVKDRRGMKGYLASKRMLPTYEKYLTYRRILEAPERSTLRLFPAATVTWRDRTQIDSLHGSKCNRCGMVHFPVQRVCYGCQAKDDFQEVRLSDKKGKLFTYSIDNLAGGIDPPVVQSVVELEEGNARVYCMMTDCDPKEVKVDMPLEMTFRRLYEGAGFHNYFWKCRPVR